MYVINKALPREATNIDIMAEKKEHKIVSASTGKETTRRPGVAAQQIGKSTVGLRIGAAVLWVLAIAAEFVGLKAILAPEDAPFIPGLQPLYWGIIFLVADLILVLLGSMLWKKANHIHPASEKNAVKFWLWNNMGVIVAVVAFAPFIIVLLTSKNVDKKTKTIGTIVAAVALAIAGLGSYDWNPYSAEEQQEMLRLENAEDNVYWTAGGKVYHIYEDCQHLDRTEELTLGTALQAEEAGKERLCKTCMKRFQKEGEVAQEEAADVLEEVLETVEDAVEENE